MPNANMTDHDAACLEKPAKSKRTRKGRRKAGKVVKMKHCDTVFRLCILAKFGHRCAVCGKGDGQVHVHHLISRAAHFFRHNLNNGIALCPRCHTFNPQLSAHAAPWAFDHWMLDNRLEQYQWWTKNRQEVFPSVKLDCAKILDVLKAELKKLENNQ